tara:strand:+ start:1592 stop:2152 length:561 start_codon:yes stop_codon:yes gene_type:complete
MINHKNKFIFIHIPKCGGNSIKSPLGIKGHHHSAISEKKYSNHMDYFKFTFVRNPWDRFLSAYSYLKAGGFGNKLDLNLKQKIESYDSFEEFILKAPFLTYLHFEPMFKLIQIDGEDRMDFIGRVENYQEDFDIICDKIGVPRKELPHTNKSKHKHYTEYYNDQTRKLIAQFYSKDVDYFGYKFGE